MQIRNRRGSRRKRWTSDYTQIEKNKKETKNMTD